MQNSFNGLEVKDLCASLEALRGSKERMLETLIHWSGVNSGSTNIAGIDEMAKLAMKRFSGIGFSALRMETSPIPVISSSGEESVIQRGPILHFSIRPEAEKRIMLAGHLDTVFPSTSAFQRAVMRDDGTLHGPGVADMKGGILVMAEGVSAFEASPWSKEVGLEIVLNSDEEVASHASSQYMENVAKSADAGFIFEPALADGTLAGARAGSGNYDVVVTGVSAHAGREFDKGRNAIVGAAKVIGALNALNGKRPDTTLNIGLVSGGTALNVVPDKAIVRLNVRARDTESLAWVDAAIRETVEQDFGEGVRAQLHGRIHRPAKPMTAGLASLFNTVRTAGSEIGIPIEWQTTGGCCDGNNLHRAGLPTVDTMGVRGAHIHSEEEYAVIESFEERARLFSLSMMMLASGAAPWPKEVQ